MHWKRKSEKGSQREVYATVLCTTDDTGIYRYIGVRSRKKRMVPNKAFSVALLVLVVASVFAVGQQTGATGTVAAATGNSRSEEKKIATPAGIVIGTLLALLAAAGTAASNLKLIDNNIALKRLKLIQDELFNHQNLKNRITENTTVDVLVENKIRNQNKFFGRTKYMTPVIFDGEKDIEGKIVPVLITSSNQNNLFGEIKLKKRIKAA